MPSQAGQRAPGLAGLAALAVIAGLSAAPFACGNLGEPAFDVPDGSPTATTTPPPPQEAAAPDTSPPRVSLHGRVEGPDGGPLLALVAIEVGGLDREPPGAVGPDGGVQATLMIDPYYMYGTATDGEGAFSVEVPDEKVGVHVYAAGYYCGVPDAGVRIPGKAAVLVRPLPLAVTDGGKTPERPTITGFTVSPAIVLPGGTLTMAAVVKSGEPGDPLSEQVLAIEPTTGWAGAFSPPVPGTWGKGYPNGIYSRLVIAPTIPGEYVYHLLAATEACVVSDPVTAHVIVSLTDSGLDALPPKDAPEDAPEDAPTDAVDSSEPSD
jgi:hypothetical protein